jgi:hypothetical protein
MREEMMASTVDHTGEAVTVPSIRDTISELASGAVFRFDSDHSPRLVRDLRQPDGGIFEVLAHRGWLESMANGGGYKLTDAGRLAYLRSTDELSDGRLLHPSEWRN